MSPIRRNVSTRPHRDYTGNTSDTMILSRQEIKEAVNKAADALSLGRISRSDMDNVLSDMLKRRVP
jgi:hypothetical protein